MVDTMRTYGLASHALDELKSAWAVRVKTLTRERYDPYGDLLYTHLLERIVPTKEVLFNTLLTTISTATTAKELEVPLWSYIAAYSKVAGEPVHETRIGTRTLGIRSLPAVPVYKIFQHTDVLAHLAAAFGADFYVYDRHVTTLTEDEDRVQTMRELVLAYYPNGLPPFLLNKTVDAYNRHFNRAPYSPAWAEVTEVLGPLETPPQSPVSTPPQLPRRT
jgi:hypothetical protein